MQRIMFRGVQFFLFIAALSFIIILSGCGVGGSSWDTSYDNGISPSSNKTPQAVIDKAKQENASKGGRAESSPIILPAGSTVTILAYSADAGTTSSFGIYQPEEMTLTGDTNHAIGQSWAIGPFSEEKNLAFWFQSGVSPRDSKIRLTPSSEGVYYIGCEDLTDDDYNDFVAQVTIKSTSKIVIENAKATPEKFNPSFNPPDNQSIITASIVAKEGFVAKTISWNVVINKDSSLVKTFTSKDGTPGSGPWNVSETWDGNNDSGTFAGVGDYTFKITATAESEDGNTVQNTASGKVSIVEKKLKILSTSITPSSFTIDQEVTLSCTFECTWQPTTIGVQSHFLDKIGTLEYGQPIALELDTPPIGAAIAQRGNSYTYKYTEKVQASQLALPKPDSYLNRDIVNADDIQEQGDTEFAFWGMGNKTLTITDFVAVPTKDGKDIACDTNHPDFYPVGQEMLRFNGTITTSPANWNPNINDIEWRLIIKSKSQTVFSLFGRGKTITGTWNGRDFDNKLVTKGEYTIKVIASAENINSEEKNLLLAIKGFVFDVTHFYQYTDSWTCNLNNNPEWPMLECGCQVCSAVMIQHFYGITSYNPKTLNTYLTENKGYFLNGDLNWVVAIDNVSRPAPNLPSKLISLGPIGTDIKQNLENCLESGNIGALGIKYYQIVQQYHCMAAKGLCRDAFLVNDPGHAYNSFKEIKFQDPATPLYKAITVSKSTTASHHKLLLHASSFNELTSSAKFPFKCSPTNCIELCLIDNLKRKAGYTNPNLKSNEVIPDSDYLKEEDLSPFGANVELCVNNPTSQTYKLQVIGIKSGVYAIECFIYLPNYNNTTINSGYKIISPGAVHEYELTVNNTTLDDFKIKKIISPGELQTSLQTAFSLTWIDNKGILNSLTKKMENADAAYKRGQAGAAINILQAFINEVEAQKGKHIASAAAEILIDDANSFIQQLQK